MKNREKDSIRNAYVKVIPSWFRSKIRPIYPLDFPLNISRSNYSFIHVPKAGGTSITHTIYGKSIPHLSATFFKNAYPDFFRKKYVFSVIRNPYERALSAYHFAKQNGTDIVSIEKNLLYNSKHFKNFSSFCQWLSYQNLNELDYIFRSQSFYLVDGNGQLLIKNLWDLNNMDELQRFLLKEFNIKIPPKAKNKINYNRQPKLSRSDKKIIENVYNIDFNNFNFC